MDMASGYRLLGVYCLANAKTVNGRRVVYYFRQPPADWWGHPVYARLFIDGERFYTRRGAEKALAKIHHAHRANFAVCKGWDRSPLGA